ncbi:MULTISPECIES: hypothetical protein [unclassified Bradyrhizobium]|uniref:hypothetical protein n=1 Tax=unclassified Bradyrhizobium TaxID=2631580 RepID=UPI002FEE94A2
MQVLLHATGADKVVTGLGVRRVAAGEGLAVAITHRDVFDHCLNNAEAVAHLKAELDAGGVRHSAQGLPLRGSEDFGRFNERSKAAMFLLGARREARCVTCWIEKI